MSLSLDAKRSASRVYQARGDLGPNERLLLVETPRFVAGALFQRVDSLWYCMETAPILKWMMGKSPEEIKISLVRMRARWEWISGASVSGAGVDRTTSQAFRPVEHEHPVKSGDADHKQIPDEQDKDTRFDPQSYPDLKGERLRKPLDTASCVVVTDRPRSGEPTQDESGVPPACDTYATYPPP